MTPFRQLLRQPVRLIAVLLLLTMAASFFSLSAGVFASAQNTLEEIERNYITIATPTSELVMTEVEPTIGSTAVTHESQISSEMWRYMDTLADSKTLIRGAYSQKFISAYSPSFRTVISTEKNGAYAANLDEPYNRAIFVIRVVSMTKDEYPFFGETRISAKITATIEAIIRLHPDYQTRETLHVSITCDSQEAYDALKLAPGQRYLLNGVNYIDDDLSLRTHIATALRLPLSSIDLSSLSYDFSAEELAEFKKHDPGYQPAARYCTKDGTGLFFEPGEIAKMNACSITPSRLDSNSFPAPFIAADGSYNGLTKGDFYTNASLTPLDTDWETFIASNPEWQLALQEVDTQYHTFSVIGTDLLESLYTFHQKESFVTDGRSFTDDEYRSGAKVCLISESTAQASSLHVGDEIDMSFYWGINSFSLSADLTWQPQPEPFAAKLGFTGEPRRYRIIGIYRQSNLWDTTGYSFTPNTVFVPAASLNEYCFTARQGAMFTYVLQNGRMQDFKDALAAQGYPTNLVFCFDGGYSKIADTLRGFHKSAAQLFIAACATSLAALLVYQALFVNRQRRTMGLMLSLGAGRKRAAWFGCRTAILPIVMATVIGAAAGLLTMNATLRSLLSSVSEVMDTAMSSTAAPGHAADAAVSSAPAAVPLAALAQCAFAALLSFLTISRMTRKSPLELIRKG